MPFSFWQKPPDLDSSAYTYGAIRVDDDALLPEISAMFCWSPIVFQNGHRLKSNFMFADFVGVDFDDGEPTLDTWIRSACDCECLIGTTRSHQKWKSDKPPCDRFRFIIRFERRCETIEEYEATMQHYVTEHCADKRAADAARFFRPSDPVFCSIGLEDMIRQEIIKPRPKIRPLVLRRMDGKFHETRLYRQVKMNPPTSAGERNVTLYNIGREMRLQGMSEEFIRRELTTIIPTRHDFTMSEIKQVIKSVLKITL